jgi:hypothetical protein
VRCWIHGPFNALYCRLREPLHIWTRIGKSASKCRQRTTCRGSNAHEPDAHTERIRALPQQVYLRGGSLGSYRQFLENFVSRHRGVTPDAIVFGEFK